MTTPTTAQTNVDPTDLNTPICAMFGCNGRPNAICRDCGRHVCDDHWTSGPTCTPCAALPALPSIPTTRANVPDDATADAYYAMIQTKAAAIKVVRAAKPARRTKAERQLELMMAQYARDVAANPNTIIYNPKSDLWDAYRNGECVAQAGSYSAAESQRMALVERDLAHTSADSPAEVGELTVEEIMDLADRPADPRCATCAGNGWIEPNDGPETCPICGGSGLVVFCQDCRQPLAAGAEHDTTTRRDPSTCTLCNGEGGYYDEDGWVWCHHGATMVHDGDVCEAYQCNAPATVAWAGGVMCPAHDPLALPLPATVVGEIVVAGDTAWAVSEYHQAPKPLPTCEQCDRPSISHTLRWCGGQCALYGPVAPDHRWLVTYHPRPWDTSDVREAVISAPNRATAAMRLRETSPDAVIVSAEIDPLDNDPGAELPTCPDCGDPLTPGAQHDTSRQMTLDACTLCDGSGVASDEDGVYVCHHGAMMIHAGLLCEARHCEAPAMVVCCGMVFCTNHVVHANCWTALPFEMVPEDYAHDQAVLESLERMAGVDDEAIVRRLAA